MMQSSLWAISSIGPDNQTRDDRVPVVLRGLVLEGQYGYHILEGVLRRLPFKITYGEKMRLMAARHQFVIFAWCVDRAFVNRQVLQCMFNQIDVLPHKNVGS